MATIIVGAGIGGLAAAIALAAAGEQVVVMERQSGPGGKLLPVRSHEFELDSGPTVLTMKWVFEELFKLAGRNLDDCVAAEPLSVLARHYWTGGLSLDLFANRQLSEQAIAEFAGASEARGFADFSESASNIHQALLKPFLKSQRPTPWGLTAAMPLSDVMRINPFETLWSAISRYFKDERLRQLFGRYATYCGSSPFHAPATLMLIADVEAAGVWRLAGGLHRLANALADCAQAMGVTFSYDTGIKSVETFNGTISAVLDHEGSRHPCRHLIVNADSAAVALGHFGSAIKHAVKAPTKKERSLSAITWCGRLRSNGVPLEHHTVFFSDDYRSEFQQLKHGSADDPTVYICDQGNDNKLILINSPADEREITSEPEKNVVQRLKKSGLSVDFGTGDFIRRGPKEFGSLYPASYGALYGKASHGWLATFTRPKAQTKIPGLYLAGGSTHPGPGVPMAALSGMRAAEALISDRRSMRM